ncbi:MAG: hypothetical protein FWB82_07510 [Treponema sp.]|nr:hypothetical protein [Treponema sp.]
MGLYDKALLLVQSGTSREGSKSALMERLQRLPRKKTTPYTALSLLKANAGFESGVCLAIKDGNYSSYTSVGFGVEKLSVPSQLMQTKENNSGGYFKLESDDLYQVFNAKNPKKDLVYWVFPLGGNAVMVAGAKSPEFDPAVVSAVLKNVDGTIFLPFQPEPAEPNSPNAAEREIALFHKTHPFFSCVVLEDSLSGEINFCQEVSAMLDSSATVVTLKEKILLILLPQSKDRDLIAHRLSHTLSAKVLFSFDSEDPSAAFSNISSLS